MTIPSHNLIGHAGELADLLPVTLAGKPRHKLLFCGSPGVGKTALAEHLAAILTQSAFGVECVNGRHVTIHVVREWAFQFATSSMFGTGWRAIVVNEVDLCQKDAQDALLSFLDQMPESRAFIGTSNLDEKALTERFRTRFQKYEVRPPEADEIEQLLVESAGLPANVARHIAGLAAGNVRAALNAAEAWHNQRPAARSTPILQQPSLAGLGF